MDEESLFAAALDLPAADRRAFLETACGDDRVRRRVARLLAADERQSGILDQTVHAPPLIEPLRVEPLLAAGRPFAGRYTLRRKLGEGGMGEVWAADQVDPVHRPVAIKVIRPGLASERALARFGQERQALAVMSHPNIAKVLDGGVECTRPYLVMELIDGQPLSEYCDDEGLTVRDRLRLFLPVCAAVQHAHQKGVIHRDLKPSNILVEKQDAGPVPRVIDFGLAKPIEPLASGPLVPTEAGSLIGTPEYMSPEQADVNNQDIDTRADVYALGVLLYELLTGSVPHSRRELQAFPFVEMLRVIREVEPPPPSQRLATAPRQVLAQVRGELDWIVMRCLEKDPARRYATASELAADLSRYLADEPVLASPPTATYRVRKFLRRHRGAVVAAAAVVLALTAGVVGTTWGMWRAERARATAEKRLAQVEQASETLGAIFEDLDPFAEEKEGRPLRAILGDRLDRVAASLDGDPLLVARLQDRLGQTYQALGNAARAAAMFRQSHQTRRDTLGANDPLTLATAGRLAAANIDRGNRVEAIDLLEQVRESQEQTIGPRHPDTLTTLSSLGWAYRLDGRFPEAVALLTRVLNEQVSQFGADDDRALATQVKLARAHMAAEEREEPVVLLRQVLEALTRTHGPDHAATIAAMNDLAYAYQYAFKMKEAMALFEQARDASRAKLGLDHRLTLSILHNLGHMHRAYNRLPEAIAVLEEVRERQVAALGGGHPATLSTLNKLATIYEDAGDGGKALALYRQAATGVERLQFAHGEADQIVYNLCRCLERRKEYAEADQWRQKWLAVAREKSGPESKAYVSVLTGHAASLVGREKYAEAEPLLRTAVTLLEKHQPAAWATLDARSLLGVALWGQGRYAAAEPLLVDSYAAMLRHPEKRLGPKQHGRLVRQRLTAVVERIVRLYDSWQKPAEAARWRKEKAALEVEGKGSSGS